MCSALDAERDLKARRLAAAVRKAGLWAELSRLALKPAEDEHGLLLIFLSLRDDDVDGALAMVTANLGWRASLGLDAFAGRPLAEVSGCDEAVVRYRYPAWYDGVDRDGRPVGWAKLGGVDIAAAAKQVSLEQLKMVHLWEREQMLRRLRAARFGCFTLVLDLKHWQARLMSRQALGFVQELLGLDTELFAQRVYAVYVINAPQLFAACFAALAPFLSARMLAMVHLHSSEAVWRPALLEAIGRAQMPAEYGGTCASCAMRDLGTSNPELEARGIALSEAPGGERPAGAVAERRRARWWVCG